MSGSELRARINGGDIAQAGVASVTVAQQVSQQLRISDAIEFTILPTANPAPVAASLSPSTATTAAPDFTLTVTGSGFTTASVVRWSGAPRSTVYESPTRLRARIPSPICPRPETCTSRCTHRRRGAVSPSHFAS